MLSIPVPKISRSISKLAVTAILFGLVSACSESQPQPATLDELMQRTDFQQCMLDSGIRPDQVSECVAANPDEPSARGCIQAHLVKKYGHNSKALDRCYELGSSPPPPPPPTGLTCYHGMAGGLTCK
jgi:hypothetical protein